MMLPALERPGTIPTAHVGWKLDPGIRYAHPLQASANVPYQALPIPSLPASTIIVLDTHDDGNSKCKGRSSPSSCVLSLTVCADHVSALSRTR